MPRFFGVMARLPDALANFVSLYSAIITRERSRRSVRSWHISKPRTSTWTELKKYFTEDQIVELTLTICMANFTNRFNDALLSSPDIG